MKREYQYIMWQIINCSIPYPKEPWRIWIWEKNSNFVHFKYVIWSIKVYIIINHNVLFQEDSLVVNNPSGIKFFVDRRLKRFLKWASVITFQD